MESPSSMRRVTRSQKAKQEDSASWSRNKGNHEGALLDITNDSPINGLATKKTPLSLTRKYRSVPNKTPGSGEALLRGQVKILLEKVEEEAELVNKLSNRPCSTFMPAMGFLPISPGLLMAPTPANTPLFFSNSRAKEVGEAVDSVLVMDDLVNLLPKVAESLKHEKFAEHQECAINRALQFDSPGKSEISEGSSHISSVTYQGSIISSGKVNSTDEDNSSNWSIQANASACANDEEDFEDFEEEDNDDYSEDYDDVEEAEEEGGSLDDLCEGLRKFTVEEDKELKLPEFNGKHTRFTYNSDDEIEGEEEVCGAERAVSPSVMVLKGLPVPEGKHLRFHEEDEE